MKRKINVWNMVFAGCIFVVGVLCIIFGAIDGNFYGYSKYVSYEFYGGDAYTGIQNAAADTANNIGRLTDLVESVGEEFFNFFGTMLILAGVLVIIVSIKMAVTEITKAKEIQCESVGVENNTTK